MKISRLIKVIFFLSILFSYIGFKSHIESVQSTTITFTKLGNLSTGGFAFDIKVRNDIVFVTDLNTGLNIIDVSDPTNPTLISLYEMEGAHKVIVDENIAYVTNWIHGFEIINITDLHNPEQLSLSVNGTELNYFDVENDYAYIGLDGLYIQDVSNPANPVKVYQYNASGSVTDVCVRQNTAYVGTYIEGVQQGFTILNVTDKTSPEELGHYNTTHYVSGIQVLDDIALAAIWEDGLLIFNISNPENPTLLSHVYDGGASAKAYFVDDYVFVADFDDGFEILNIDDPTSPIEIGQFYDGGFAYGIAIQNNIAFVADNTESLEIIEISGLFQTLENIGFTLYPFLLTMITIILYSLIKNRRGQSSPRRGK